MGLGGREEAVVIIVRLQVVDKQTYSADIIVTNTYIEDQVKLGNLPSG